MTTISRNNNHSIVISDHCLNAQLNHLQNQRMAMVLGAIFYPTVALLVRKPSIAAFSFFCVGTHYLSTRMAYFAAQQELTLGTKITHDPEFDQALFAKIREGRISRFYFDLNGNLVFLKNPSGFSWAKGMSLHPAQKEKMNREKSLPIFHPHLKNQISYFDLDDETQRLIDRIVEARSLRFRSGLAMAVGTSLLIRAVSGPPCLAMGCIIAGSLHLSTIKSYKVAYHTNHLWYRLNNTDDLHKIIKPQHREKYTFPTPSHLKVTLFGNIRFSEKAPLVPHVGRDSFQHKGRFPPV